MGEPFAFAGFEFPRIVPEFYRSAHNTRRLADGREVRARMRFAYRHAPRPNSDGASFYHASDFAPRLRWTWADEVSGVRIRHRGWFCDRPGEDDTIRGVVFRLPHGRGFVAGWAMGEGMIAELAYSIMDDEAEAARAADELARIAAECNMEAAKEDAAEDCEA